jgi:DNA-binding transcriptional LysR family regulator
MQIPRSTVSLHVKTLEDEVGVRLLRRSTRAIALTEEGRFLYENANDSLEALQRALEELQGETGELSGLIRVTAPADFPGEALADAVTGFKRLHPKTRFELLLTNTTLDMVGSNIDIAIGFTQRTDENRVARRLMTVPWGFFAHSTWLTEHGEPQDFADLSDFISPPPAVRAMLERQVLSNRLLPKSSIMASSQLMVRDLVLAGAGVGLLPKGMLDFALQAGIVREVLESLAVSETELYLEFPGRADILPRTRAFASHFESCLRR